MNTRYVHGTAEAEQSRLQDLNRITNDSFIQYLGLLGNERIADFGCGLGNLLVDLATRYPRAALVGIEKLDEQYQGARQNTVACPNITLFKDDILGWRPVDEPFDVVYCRYLLEHVGDAVNAVRSMLRTLRPGGRVYVQENDLHNVLYDPEIPGHSKVMQAFCHLQQRLGGDPFIGRKLFRILREAGSREIEIAIEPELHVESDPESFRAWLNNSERILLGAKRELVALGEVSATEIAAVTGEMRRRIEEPTGVAIFYWNRASARKGS